MCHRRADGFIETYIREQLPHEGDFSLFGFTLGLEQYVLGYLVGLASLASLLLKEVILADALAALCSSANVVCRDGEDCSQPSLFAGAKHSFCKLSADMTECLTSYDAAGSASDRAYRSAEKTQRSTYRSAGNFCTCFNKVTQLPFRLGVLFKQGELSR